jgi:hypothetical protein
MTSAFDPRPWTLTFESGQQDGKEVVAGDIARSFLSMRIRSARERGRMAVRPTRRRCVFSEECDPPMGSRGCNMEVRQFSADRKTLIRGGHRGRSPDAGGCSYGRVTNGRDVGCAVRSPAARPDPLARTDPRSAPRRLADHDCVGLCSRLEPRSKVRRATNHRHVPRRARPR